MSIGLIARPVVAIDWKRKRIEIERGAYSFFEKSNRVRL